MTEREIFTVAIQLFGERMQEEVAIEECGELIQAIVHKIRGRKNNIPEENADVEIMLEQLKIIENCAEEVATIRAQKVERLYNRICDASF